MVRPRNWWFFDIRESRKSQCFQWFSALLENSAPRTVIETRNWRDTTFATPRLVKNYWILLWSVMWSKPLFRGFCVRLKVRKVQCFQGFSAFLCSLGWTRDHKYPKLARYHLLYTSKIFTFRLAISQLHCITKTPQDFATWILYHNISLLSIENYKINNIRL